MRKTKLTALVLAACLAIGTLPIAAAADTLDGTLYIFDLKTFLGTLPDSATQYDYFKLATALQGLVNREKPRLYFLYESTSFNAQQGFDVDAFWLAQLSAQGKYLSACTMDRDTYPPTPDGFFALLEDFSVCWDGFVLWDSGVPATANAASTAAGVRNLLPVRGSSGLYGALFPARYALTETKLDLVGKFTGQGTIWETGEPSTGSAKNDTYLWAKAKFLDTGLTNPLRMAYCTDAWIAASGPMFWTTLANADFHIARKAFFWDLSPDDRIAPIDDRGQPVGTDVATLNKLLYAQARQSGFNIFSVSGFVPWNFKYTFTSDPAVSKMGDVESEWTMVNRISSYGGQTEADANAGVGDISNCSVFMHVPLNGELKQNNGKGAGSTLNLSCWDACKQTVREWFLQCGFIAGSSVLTAIFKFLLGPLKPSRHYISIYMGDYDSASWTSGILPMLWEGSKADRGKYPLCWPIGTGLADRIPQLFNYLYENATPGDYFVAGNNGAAYLNATMFEEGLRPAGMPDLLPKWEAYNIARNRRFDIQVQGFYINTDQATRSTDDVPRRVMEAYSRMTPVGVNVQAKNAFPGGVARITNSATGAVTPFINYRDIGGADSTPQQLADAIYDVINCSGGSQREVQFHMLRCVLIPPGVINQALDLLAAGQLSGGRNPKKLCYDVVDPYTLFRLAGQK
ncbi:MAG: hypothetical protein FWC27_10455 [Firmicutes bacterium]|nr:hypothetical protein [Bacillota bacterium]